MAGGFSRTAAPWTAGVLVHGDHVKSDSVSDGCSGKSSSVGGECVLVGGG